jgi:murein tripeptide amidase MpaA
MTDVQFDRFYRYDDLAQILQRYAQEYPHLVRVDSIGSSFEGRDILLATITNFETGEDKHKPALWVDGNIHSVELSASTACLYLINRLVTAHGTDETITRCLDTRTFYVCPRVNPDGAEWALADKPKFVRSSTRPYPVDEEPLEGLLEEDIDGDGRILTMRIPDPNGPWKVCPEEPRLLIRRLPTERGGTYYRLLPEGHVENYDGALIQLQSRKERLDLNRNFPYNWRQEYQQKGAGPYPTSEKEARALSQFISEHPNITGGVAFHTFSGVILRPYDDRDDDTFPAEDLWTYQKIGQQGKELTNYPAISIYHDFRYHPKDITTGGFDTWLYDHLGIFAWTVELWSPQRQAGIEEYKFIEWYREHPLEDDLKMLQWSDEKLGAKGYVDWYPFEHPQLGQVELGGWDRLYAFTNPPPDFLEQEVAPFSDWLVWHLLISPRLEFYEVRAKPLGEDSYQIRVVVHNTGWLPTYVTKKALEKKTVRGVICELGLPEGATLETGKLREELGQLEGRAYKPVFSDDEDFTEDRAKVEWVIRAPQGGTVDVTARHERAGTVVAQVELT